MNLDYIGKKSEPQILNGYETCGVFNTATGQYVNGITDNLLIYSDNLFALKALMNTHHKKIDLIYIDPPFATNNNFRIGLDRVSTISSSKSDRIAYSDIITEESYLEFLRERLVILRELLSDEGSIYLHIDYKIGHYVKIIMDEIFGQKNFLNDITRIKCNPKNFHRKAYGNIKDMILFYSKSNRHIWNDVTEALTEKDRSRLYKKLDKHGNPYTTIPLHAPGESNGDTGKPWRGIQPPVGRHWRTNPTILEQWNEIGLIEWSKTGNPRKIVYPDVSKGKKIQDIWEFKDPQRPLYPTEKNLNLLEQIILNSSNKDSYVLDCFCGSGTTIVAAELHDRRWIGIDQSSDAIRVVQNRLNLLDCSYENCIYQPIGKTTQTTLFSGDDEDVYRIARSI